MNELELSRKEITRIDGEMARLFQQRMAQAETIAKYKMANGLSIKDPQRETDLINRNRSLIESAETEAYYVRFLRNVIDLSCDYQSKIMNGMRVAYSGVEGAFAHIAAKKMFPTASHTACDSFSAAYKAVENGEFDCAVLPLENSYAGDVVSVMDLLFSGELYVNQVIDLPIVHNLISVAGATLDGIKTVVSHPQALSQCADYIASRGYTPQAYSNTALAAKYVMEKGDPTIAAIASDETAEIFGLNILETNINDAPNNTTRFAALSRAQNRPSAAGRRENENFILVFTVQNEAGALAQILNIIGVHGFNMRSLRSRPMKELQWNYFFYIEAEGNINNANGQDMMRELSAVCAKLKLVGTYYANNV